VLSFRLIASAKCGALRTASILKTTLYGRCDTGRKTYTLDVAHRELQRILFEMFLSKSASNIDADSATRPREETKVMNSTLTGSIGFHMPYLPPSNRPEAVGLFAQFLTRLASHRMTDIERIEWRCEVIDALDEISSQQASIDETPVLT
jgi:hypothetical protein